MNLAELSSPIFIAKLVDFVIFAAGITFVYNRFLKKALVDHQEAQNKAVEDAVAYRERCAKSVEEAGQKLEQAKVDAVRMVEVAQSQATRLTTAERTSAEEQAGRIVAHANGELERERYRVRSELLEETVERAHARAREIVRSELNDAGQRMLIERFATDLETARRA